VDRFPPLSAHDFPLHPPSTFLDSTGHNVAASGRIATDFVRTVRRSRLGRGQRLFFFCFLTLVFLPPDWSSKSVACGNSMAVAATDAVSVILFKRYFWFFDRDSHSPRLRREPPLAAGNFGRRSLGLLASLSLPRISGPLFN